MWICGKSHVDGDRMLVWHGYAEAARKITCPRESDHPWTCPMNQDRKGG